MKKALMLIFTLVLVADLVGAKTDNDSNYKAGKGAWCKDETIARFGVITDIHHTNKPDIPSRKYSAALKKTKRFVSTMNKVKADFIVELGDYVDTLVDDKDPIQNLDEVESIYKRFRGPRYHVLGNHDFDNVSRADFLDFIGNTGIPAEATYYSFDRNGIHCIVLDADYTVAEPHLPFDLQDPTNPFWNWKDAWVPQEELDWLETDLASANRPTVVFTHQVMHRDNTEDHTIKNADVVRGILEDDGQVVAVFSGHDHRGEIAVRNGIHYFVLEGNVGVSLDWAEVSPTEGVHPRKDSPYTFVEIKENKNKSFNEMKTYEISLIGNAQQYSYEDQVQIVAPSVAVSR
jgi:alkaline phosphatase